MLALFEFRHGAVHTKSGPVLTVQCTVHKCTVECCVQSVAASQLIHCNWGVVKLGPQELIHKDNMTHLWQSQHKGDRVNTRVTQ